MTSWVGHNEVWNEHVICRGGRGKNFPYMIKAKKKCTFVNTNLCFTLIQVSSMQVSFPPLLNMKIKKPRIPLTTYCSISLSYQFQQAQYHDTCFQESLSSLFFFNSLLIHLPSTNLCHPIWNPKMNSWWLSEAKSRRVLCKKGNWYYIMVLCHVFF